MARRIFDEAFKADAVRLATSSSKTAAQVARELDISPNNLNNWIRERKMRPGDRAPSASEDCLEPETIEDENRRLRRENAQLIKERDFLKKATAYFAKDHK